MNEANIKRDAKRILKAVKTLQPLAIGEDRVFDPETGVGYSVGEQLNHIKDAVQGILGEIGAAHTDLNQSKKLKSSRKSVKSGFYDDPVNHPEGGGTCDYCGAEVAPGDYYEASLDSTHDHAAMQLYLALGGDPNYAYEVVENIHNFVIWLQQADENIDEDTVQDMISEVVDMAFPNYNDYFCHDCLDSRLRDAAKKWVEENW